MPRTATRVVVDTRPLWIILLTRSRPLVMLAIGILIFWVIKALPAPEGLSASAQGALAVFGICIFYWMFEVLPIMITGLLAIVLLPLTGVMTSKDAYSQFGNEAVFFILGAFILAAAMMQSGLSARMALVLGGETGLRPLVERHCDYRLTIPVRPGVESLNASVAGAIAMYELIRPRTLTR